jgi:hypothetical protein
VLHLPGSVLSSFNPFPLVADNTIMEGDLKNQENDAV